MNLSLLMDPVYLILGSAFVSVLALVLWLISVFTDRSESDLEARLTAFTGRTTTTRTEIANAILRDGLTTSCSGSRICRCCFVRRIHRCASNSSSCSASSHQPQLSSCCLLCSFPSPV
jgi:hypothetical protein